MESNMLKTAYSVLIAVAIAVAGCASLPGHYLSLPGYGEASLDEILLRARNDDAVIFVGEGHGMQEDHLVQFEVIRRLREKGIDVAIALEMFPSGMQEALNQWVQGAMSRDDFRSVYYKSWTVPYRYYSRIFEYARQERIPLVGINGIEAQIKSVARSGPDKLPQEFRKAIRFIPCAKAPDYEKTIAFFEGRITHNQELPFLCDAQRLRDTLMAYNIVDIYERGRFTIVALVGATHALKSAVPGILLRTYNVNSVSLMSGDFAGLLPQGLRPADYIWQ
jgi:uncharacterized iron-regulated protein